MNIYDFVLSRILNGFNPAIPILIRYFLDSKRILNSNNDDLSFLLKKNKISETFTKSFFEKKERYNLDTAPFIGKCNQEIKKIRESGVEIITFSDSEYPEQLRLIPAPPLVLYAKGDINFDYNKSIAIVGTRNVSSYAFKKVCGIAEDLSKKGYCIISGLARGIDGISHRAALNSKGKTIAVLPLGINRPYPSEHKVLYEEILKKKGCLVAEDSGWKKGFNKQSFLNRNRIISGLSKGIFIVEGSKISGSLSQYNHAKEQGKLILTLKPKSYSEATYLQKIISKEGFVVENADQIIEILNQANDSQTFPSPPLSS